MDYDKYGHCVRCHESLIVGDKNDKGEPIERLSGKAEHLELDLNDGSKMRVLICNPCKTSYTPAKHSTEIMDSVIKGWEVECNQLVADETKPQFDSSWKEKYMEVYSKKEILI